MNVKNENRLNMYLVVADYLNAAPAGTIASMPDFAQTFAEFLTNLQIIQAKSEAQSASRLGYRIAKTAGKEEVVGYAMNMNNCIAAYAEAISDAVLEEQMKFTKSDLLKKRDTATLDDVQFLHSKAITLLNNLTPYGVAQAQIDTFKSAIITFTTNIPLPRNNIVKNKMLTKDIEEHFIICNDLTVRMDKLVKILRLTDKAFCTEYFFSRKVVNNHGRKLAVRGLVLDATGNPVSNVTVTVPTLGKETKTSDRGYYEFKNLPKGMQRLYFARVDYQAVNRTVGIIAGERVQLDVTMEAATNSQDVA